MNMTIYEIEDEIREAIKKDLYEYVGLNSRKKSDKVLELVTKAMSELTDQNILDILCTAEHLGYATAQSYGYVDVQSIVRSNLAPELWNLGCKEVEDLVEEYNEMVDNHEEEGYGIQFVVAGQYWQLLARPDEETGTVRPIGRSTFGSEFEAWNWLERQVDI